MEVLKGVATLVDPSEELGEAAARELISRFEDVVDSLDTGVLLQDTGGRALVSNAAARRILGLSARQLAGVEPLDPGWAILHEDGWPLPRAELPSRLALRSRRPCRDVLLAIKHPDARLTWVSASAHPLTRHGNERPHAVALSLTDVTESRAATEAEQRSRDRFRSLIEHSSDVVTIVDDRGRVTYESPAVEAVLGYAPGELVGPGRLGRVHPDDVNAAVTAVTGLIGRPGESVSCEYRIQARDGRWRVLESVAANRLHDPAVLGIVIHTRDVTERRETEAALRATTSRLENLVQNLQAGVLVEDETRRIALVNSEMLAALSIDLPPEAMVGADCSEAARAVAHLLADPERFADRIEEVVAGGVPVRGEEIAFADGRTFERDYIPVAAGPLDRGHMWLYRDISRRKGEEREAARLRDEAIRAARLKTEFLATMSHEIRTPMNGVLGTIELLLDTALEPHQRELAALVRDASLGLLTVVNDALDLSKIEAEKLEPRAADLDLAAVVEGVADVVLSAARRKGLTVSVFVDPRLPPRLRGDAQWLRQVLVNLAANAVKFTPAGDVRIRAELVFQGSRSTTVRFTVADTGVGIPASARERLFEPFVQLDAPAVAGSGGTGLGLAICRRLVRLMGSEIEVASEVGNGSSFSFPVALQAAAPNPGQGRMRARGARGVRVLIAEPVAAQASIAADYLVAWGIDAQHAVSASGARERAVAAARAGRPFDVAIVGIGGPGKAALVAAELRALEGCGDMVLVLLKDVGAQATEPAGVFASELTRPLKQSRLYEAVVGAPAAVVVEAEPARAPLPEGLRVLVAEDNEVNRELMARQLATLGVAADTVASGREAVTAAIAERYDAVLMDFHMPELDGVQAARAIRAIPGQRGATPIVAVTASGGADEREAFLAAGMSELLQKPISSRDLAGALWRVLNARAIDPAALERLEADLGDRPELSRIAGIYLGQLEAGTRAISAARSAGEREALRRAAHRLGSASATFGAGRVAELCRRLERVGSADPAGSGAELARALEGESARAAKELRALLELS
jgi:PAS domain S-box-containing protein